MSIVANVGVLAVFKYYNFFIENINAALTAEQVKTLLPLLKMVLPIGLSFHTFQAMSYTIEVYRGNQKAEKHFGIYSLYVMFYPQLVAGPIERPQNILHQFYEKKEFSYDNVANGLRQMTWGLMKKTLVADRIALMIDPLFETPQHFTSSGLFIALFCYAFQIYCDFSGYSDIALGAARVMGYDLMVNFNHPFRSKGITEFWRRWHISLSTWFNDYLFNPMMTGLRNWGKSAVVFSLIITFLLSGFWHGAGWKFIIFGALHGIAVAYEFITRKQRKKIFSRLPMQISTRLSVMFTFLFAIYSWIFFRANSVADAMYIAKKVPCVFGDSISAFRKYHSVRSLFSEFFIAHINFVTLGVTLLSILLLEVVHKIEGEDNIWRIVGNKPKAIRWSIYISAYLLIAYFGVFNNKQFIYFQF